MASSNRFRTILVEVGSIVIGVLVALGANEWNENRVHRERADEAMLDIASEIVSNQKLLQHVNENNSRIVRATRAKETSDDERQFIPGLQIQDTAWKTMIATGVAEYVEYDVLRLISAAYSFQEIYRELSYQMIQNFMSTAALATAINPQGSSDLPDDLFLANMQLVVLTEEGLMTRYTEAVKMLEKKGYLASQPAE
jgi:hypothetical protein